MQMPIGRDDSAIAVEPASGVKVERPSVEIGDTSACFLNGQRAGGMIPDVFAVVGAGGDAHEKIGVPGCNRHVFCLAVHQDGRTLDAGRTYQVARSIDVDM